jgi:hypothetical protein
MNRRVVSADSGENSHGSCALQLNAADKSSGKETIESDFNNEHGEECPVSIGSYRENGAE